MKRLSGSNTSCKSRRSDLRLLSILLPGLFFLTISCSQPDTIKSEFEAGFKQSYLDSLMTKRMAKDDYFADTSTSPLNRNNIEGFTGLRYFEADPAYILEAILVRDTVSEVFSMPTTTERAPRYRVYGMANFMLEGQACQLTVFQNIDLLERNPASTHLFLPFKDLTNTTLTYGGGRYLDLEIPANDTILIDFNYAYNPYCVYDDRWSCPLTPPENYLEVTVRAGEMIYP